MNRTCNTCGAELTKRSGESNSNWRTRTHCSIGCYNRGRAKPVRTYAARTQARIEDVTFLLDHQEAPERIAARLGITPSGLERWLERHQRYDLASQFRGVAA